MPSLFAAFYLSQPVIMLLFVFVIGFSIYAQIRVSSAYSKNAKIPSRGGITGREAAAAVMSRAGIADVEIVETSGHLTDHYDPANKKLVAFVGELPRDEPRGDRGRGPRGGPRPPAPGGLFAARVPDGARPDDADRRRHRALHLHRELLCGAQPGRALSWT